MTVGLPGAGIGGMFYILSAFVMPLREALRRGPERPAGAWRAVATQLALTAGILAAMGATGWLIATLFVAVRDVIPTAILPGHGLPTGNVLRSAMLVLTIGTLVAVLITVELVRLWVHRSAPRTGLAKPSDPPRQHPRWERRAHVRLGSSGQAALPPQETEWLLSQAQER